MYNINMMNTTETLLIQIRDLLQDIRYDLHELRGDNQKMNAQSIKESKARTRAINKQLLTETVKNTQERILKNG